MTVQLNEGEGEKKVNEEGEEKVNEEGEKKEEDKANEEGEKKANEEQKDAHQTGDNKINNNEVVLQKGSDISSTIQKNRHDEKYEQMKKKKLTSNEKEELFLAMNLQNVSHQNIRKASNLDYLSDLKMLFLEALSLKLNKFEKYDDRQVSQNYKFNENRSQKPKRDQNQQAKYQDQFKRFDTIDDNLDNEEEE